MTLAISGTHRTIVQATLSKHLPLSVRIHAFGSRANGRPRRVSDLDLLLDADGPIDRMVIADLRDAFDESDLPYKVDLVDRASISDEFARAIENELVLFERS